MTKAIEQPFVTRFDFGCAPRDGEATLNDLLDEINRQEREQHESPVDIKTLGVVLEFIGDLTGREYKSVLEALPIGLLKCVKLLYIQDSRGELQLCRYLRAPEPDDTATFEFRTTGVAPRNEKRVNIARHLIETVGKDLPTDLRQRIDQIILTASKLLECIRRENEQIVEPLYARLPEVALPAAFRLLAKRIASLPALPRNPGIEAREALYIHISILPFLHFVGEYKTGKAAALRENAAASPAFTSKTFQDGLAELGAAHRAFSPGVTSLDEFTTWVEANAPALVAMTAAATGRATQRRDITARLDFSMKVLHMLGFHENGRFDTSARIFSAADCLAAICAARHQQGEKTTYQPMWQGQTSSEIKRSVFGQMSKGRPVEDLYEEDYIPQGINQRLYQWFCEFRAHFEGHADRHYAFMDFQLARLHRYCECLRTGSIEDIVASIGEFNNFCEQEACAIAGFFPIVFENTLNAWLKDGR